MGAITVLTPTGTLGYGFGAEALEGGMALRPDVIAVDAGSTDPGPHYLGSGETLVSRFSTKRELSDLLSAARGAGIPLVVGSAGGAGSRRHVDWTVDIVREIARERGLHAKIAWIYADIPIERARRAVRQNEVQDFEAGFLLTEAMLDDTVTLVAQMGHEPIAAALDGGADIVVAGRACDDSTIAAFPIARGADPGLAMHMGKILECGAFSAEPFGMDVMVGTVAEDHFLLEPGSRNRRASLTSVAAHSLYERENPIRQAGPGHEVDLSDCRFEQVTERRVRVSGSRFIKSGDYWVKLEGARRAGYRTICIAGIRCPTMLARIDDILDEVRAQAIDYFAPASFELTFHVYGRDGVMGRLEPQREITSQELGLVIDVVASDQELAHAVCHQISGSLLHLHYPGQFNTSGNLAFPYSPSEIDAGPVYRFSAYHLMKAASPLELFPVNFEDL
ncbi:MAG TPA: acyclic terpene utilization AtuA family protein [Stellaceae bacterium]|nr:acyclic terpene utilization AtuA family protein [Stellaceae bacterium]